MTPTAPPPVMAVLPSLVLLTSSTRVPTAVQGTGGRASTGTPAPDLTPPPPPSPQAGGLEGTPQPTAIRAGDDGGSPPDSSSFASVAAGFDHTCGVRIDGSVVCWGSNTDGQASPPAGSFAEVSGGHAHTCGLKNDETIACWGSDDHGQASPPKGSFASISAGTAHSCGLKTDGSAVCWGDGQFGKATPPDMLVWNELSRAAHTARRTLRIDQRRFPPRLWCETRRRGRLLGLRRGGASVNPLAVVSVSPGLCKAGRWVRNRLTLFRLGTEWCTRPRPRQSRTPPF